MEGAEHPREVDEGQEEVMPPEKIDEGITIQARLHSMASEDNRNHQYEYNIASNCMHAAQSCHLVIVGPRGRGRQGRGGVGGRLAVDTQSRSNPPAFRPRSVSRGGTSAGASNADFRALLKK